MRSVQRLLTLSASVLLLLVWAGQACAIDGAGIRAFTVESQPSGAEVFTITGGHGTTPLTLDERDIYPNSYAPEKVDQYGKVTLRKSGCREMNIRPGEEDIVAGLSLRLDCGENTLSDGVESATKNADPVPPAQETRPPSGDTGEALASRKLEQLRFLQELLDEGLITDEEEARIRNRILQQR